MFTKRTYQVLSAKFASVFLILFLILAAGCKSTGRSGEGVSSKQGSELNKLIKYPDVMLWEIDGQASDGTPSKVYLLGTYHAGDERGVDLPQSVLDALEESDRFCGELSDKVMSKLSELVQTLTIQSFLTDLSHTLIDDLTPDEISLINQFVDAQTFAQLVCFEPWVLNNYLQQIVMLAADLDSTKAYDYIIINYIQTQKNNQGFEGLDAAQTQLDLISYGDWNTQMMLLRDTLDGLKDLQKSADEMTELYEIFLSGDEDAVEQMYFEEFENEINKSPIYKEYYSLLLNQRNQDWAVKIADYLEQPGVTFVFAGCAHFIGPDSVFAYMRTNGDLNY